MKDVRLQFYLDPFPTHSDTAIETTKRKYAAKTNCTALSSTVARCLALVPRHATLVIDGHGYRDDASAIGADWHAPMRISYQKLAAMIAGLWQLPRSHVKIRMLACWGTGFAMNLARELGHVHQFADIRVAGYNGATQVGVFEAGTGRGRNAVQQAGMDDYDYDSPDRVWWYDRAGTRRDKPDVGAQAVVGTSASEWD